MRTSRPFLAAAAVAGLAFAPLTALDPAGSVPADLASGCASSLTGAADLVAMSPTDEVRRASVLGVDIAVVLDPMVPPGIPTPVLDTDAGLCTVDTFNLTVAPTLGDAGTVASVFASVAGMQWLGDVEVRDLQVTADGLLGGDTVTLTTFGGRHGVTSEWTLAVDALGVREAAFTTTDFGAGLDGAHVADLEGVTSRPGHGRSWTRDASGLLAINATIVDDLEASLREREAAARNAAEIVGAPGDFLEFTGADGQVVRITMGVAATGVETPTTSVPQADRLTHLFEGLHATYTDFESWGLSDPWDNTARTYFGFSTVAPDTAGYVNISSGLSAYCLACAFLADVIEVHAEYAFPEVAQELVGVSYPDAEDFFVDVMGHELVHSMQGGYANGGDRGLTVAFTEGTARASETLYRGAVNSDQPDSIQYVDNGNGCEGFENGRGGWIAAQAAGPFLGHTYDACYLWWSYYAQHGGEGLVRLLASMPQAGDGNAAARNIRVLDAASTVSDGTLDLAYWAAAYATGSDADGYTVTDATGVDRDWYRNLSPIAVRTTDLRAGQSHALNVQNGGTAAFELRSAGTVLDLPAGAEAFAFEVHDGHLDLVGPVTVGSTLSAGQILTVVAPTADGFSGSVALG